MQQQENQQFELEEYVRTAAVMKSRNSKEQAKKMVNINKQLDAGRARHNKSILAKAMQKWNFSLCTNNQVQ